MKSTVLQTRDFCKPEICLYVNSFFASGDCRLLITIANSLDQDQDRHNVGPDLDPNCLILIAFLKDFFVKS